MRIWVQITEPISVLGVVAGKCDPRVLSESQEMEAVQSLEAHRPASLVQWQRTGHTSGDVESKGSNLRSDLHATNMFSHTCVQAHKHTEKLLLHSGIVKSEFKTSTEYLPGLNSKGPRRGGMTCAGFGFHSHALEIWFGEVSRYRGETTHASFPPFAILDWVRCKLC